MLYDNGSAVLSDCKKYRYKLQRGACTNPLIFIMLNPSTADADVVDPTLRRCVGFAQNLGHDGVILYNLYALRSSNPKDLWVKGVDPVGPCNDAHLQDIPEGSSVVCAWGAGAKPERVAQVRKLLLSKGVKLVCLAVTKDHQPRHPLYLPKDSTLRTWDPSRPWDKE